MNLPALIADDSTPIAAIAEALEASSHTARLDAVLALNRGQQRALYRKAAQSPPVTLEDFLPHGSAPGASIRHHGRNTLPLPRALQFFEKRCCMPQDGNSRVFGYNHWPPMTRLIGPGYFVAEATKDNAAWEERGAIVVDYYQVPDGPVVAGWPEIVPNTVGLQKFIFHRTRDFMRRVSRDVTIGAAFRNDKPLDHYFVLVRTAA